MRKWYARFRRAVSQTEQLHLGIAPRHANATQQKAVEKDDVPPALIDRIVDNNSRDMALYERAVAQHESRYGHFCEGIPWCHGYCMITAEGKLTGAAFWATNDDAVELSVRRNGEAIESLRALHFHRREVKSQLPRLRYVGFQAQLAPPLDDIEVSVTATGQKLPLHTEL